MSNDRTTTRREALAEMQAQVERYRCAFLLANEACTIREQAIEDLRAELDGVSRSSSALAAQALREAAADDDLWTSRELRERADEIEAGA